METVLLAIHLILALLLVGVVLLQRSEGGGLGMGTGGGVVSGRSAATALGKVTWGLAAGFIATSIILTVFSAKDAAQTSVIDQIGGTQAPVETAPAPDATQPATPDLGAVPSTLPSATDAPATPPKVGD